MLRVVFFGSGGPLSEGALDAVSSRHDVVAVVAAAPRARRGPFAPLRAAWRRLRPPRTDLSARAAALGVPHLAAHGRADPAVTRRLRALAPDIICIAGYPWLLPAEVFTIPRLGAINLHTSLLPRHRGVMPLFWLYHADDRETGVTVHRVTAHADSGDILARESFPFERGAPITGVHARCAVRGAALLAAALEGLAAGTASQVAQDDRLATAAPMVRPGTPMARFDSWDVERVWHFLAGLYPLFTEPLRDAAASPVTYRGVVGYERVAHTRTPGSVEREGGRITLYCRGGVVHLVAGAPAA